MPSLDTTPDISVIVPAFNEESVIGQCLASLQAQALAVKRFEVLVVDNGSADRTAAIARSFADFLPITVLERKGVRISALRNLGAANARGAYLAFLDADCVAPRNWLGEALDTISTSDARIVGAQYRIPAGSSRVAVAWYGDSWRTKTGTVSYVPGGNLIVKRKLFVNLGGFDESIITSEDCEFCDRAARAGVVIVAVPSLSVVHLGTPQTLLGFYRKQSWHGINVHRIFLRDILHSKSRKAVFFALYMLMGLIMTVAGACTAAIVNGAVGVGVVIPAIWLLLGPILLAARGCAERKNWSHLMSLTVLFAAYGLARAMCLLGLGGRREPRALRCTAIPRY